jgi:hypothetical protein
VARDDERLAALSRALRRRSGFSQRKLAALASVPRDDIQLIEAGKAGSVRLDRVRAVFAGLEATVRVSAWWGGAAADRLLDERHAALSERAISLILRAPGWVTLPEVTFSGFGERGSIDIFGGHEATRSVVVSEVKASIGSFEERNRSIDVKERHAAKLAGERFFWRPRSVSRVLVVPEDSTVRRILRAHRETVTSLYPQNSREFRRWLRKPDGRIAAVWFLSEAAASRHVSAPTPSKHVK